MTVIKDQKNELPESIASETIFSNLIQSIRNKIQNQIVNIVVNDVNPGEEIRKFMDTEEINISDMFINTSSPEPYQIKNYIGLAISKMLHMPPIIPEYYGRLNDKQIMDITQYISFHYQSMEGSLHENDLILPQKSQKHIDDQLQLFLYLSNDETILSTKKISDLDKIKNCWPFINGLIESGIISCEIELTYITRKSESCDVLVDNIDVAVVKQLSKYRYHLSIRCGNKQIIVCHQPEKGYLVQNLEESQMSIVEYNCQFEKSGYHCIYRNNLLKMILKYENNQLNGQSCSIINGQASVMIDYKDNRPHGLLRVIDASKKILYSELFHEGNSLLKTIDLNN